MLTISWTKFDKKIMVMGEGEGGGIQPPQCMSGNFIHCVREGQRQFQNVTLVVRNKSWPLHLVLVVYKCSLLWAG